MADGCENGDVPHWPRNQSENKSNDAAEEGDVEDAAAEPDLGISGERNFQKKCPENIAGTSNGLPRREDNPFSFKHFLKRDLSCNFHRTGARPKVYIPSDSFEQESTEPVDCDVDEDLYNGSVCSRHVGTPELTSVLPDFVQDHLVIEQCYLGHSGTSKSPQLAVDLDNLPDFARDECQDYRGRVARQWDEPENITAEDIPFDLTDTTPGHHCGAPRPSQRSPGSIPSQRSPGSIPLDLPEFDRSAVNPEPSGGLPFDLPLTTSNGSMAPASGPQVGEPVVSKRLPDFLSDGPIHSDRQDASQSTNVPVCSTTNVVAAPGSSDHLHQRLILENERLRRELEGSRRQLSEQSRRVQVLEKELLVLRSKEHEETTTLEKAIEQVEDNLKRTTKRAVTAENMVSKLKQEIKMLTWEQSSLRQENDQLRAGEAGASGPYFAPSERQSQRLAQDLRAAAGTAEHSLRQLLSGVSNLRIIADTIENMHKIQDRSEDFLADSEDDAGPAL